MRKANIKSLQIFLKRYPKKSSCKKYVKLKLYTDQLKPACMQ